MHASPDTARSTLALLLKPKMMSSVTIVHRTVRDTSTRSSSSSSEESIKVFKNTRTVYNLQSNRYYGLSRDNYEFVCSWRRAAEAVEEICSVPSFSVEINVQGPMHAMHVFAGNNVDGQLRSDTFRILNLERCKCAFKSWKGKVDASWNQEGRRPYGETCNIE